jgi:hypothetical protein
MEVILMEETKMDFSAGKNQIVSKATKILLQTKGKKVRVFSEWRQKNNIPWGHCWVDKYVKAWV